MINICAIEYISLSELQTVDKSVTKEWIEQSPTLFKRILYSLGMDVYNFPVEEQYNTHRNRFGNVVTDFRWVGNSRTDSEWINSGYASIEAVDRSKNNALLVDLYRQRGMADYE